MKFKMAAAALLNYYFCPFWCQPATSLQNFIHLHQSAAEILLFGQKSKMAVAAILDLIFVQYFGM